MKIEDLKTIQQVAKNRLGFWQIISQLVDEKIASLKNVPTEQNLFNYEEEIKKTVINHEGDRFLTRFEAANFLNTSTTIIVNLKTNGLLHVFYNGDSGFQLFSLKELQAIKADNIIPKNIVSTTQAAKMCNLSATSIRLYVRNKFLAPVKKISSSHGYFFRKEDVEKLIEVLKVGESYD